MILSEWEIWHTYSTYVDGPPVDVVAATHSLVESGLAELAMHKEGLTVWRHENRILQGNTNIELAADGNSCSMTMEPPLSKDNGPFGFAAEAWAQAGHFRYCQLRVLGDRNFPPEFTRAFLGEYRLYATDEKLSATLYPVLVIYETGVLSLEFRIISPEHDTPLEEFIDRFVNLFQVPLDRVEASPSLSKLAVRAHYRASNRLPAHLRLALLWLERRHDVAVASATNLSASGPFTFAHAPLSRGAPYDTLADVALTALGAVVYVLGRPPHWFRYVLRGHRNPFRLGNYWSGRPHIHLTRFRDQQELASANDRMFGPALERVYNRGSRDPRQGSRPSMSANLRAFDDYSVFVGPHMTLWVWSQAGLRQQEPWADPNRGHLIYEHQATAEVLEYGALLQRALFERAAYGDSLPFHELRLKLVRAQQGMSEATHFGELRRLLVAGWREMGVNQLQGRIREALEVRGSQASERASQLAEWRARALTTVFGLVAVPPLADQVVRPIWQLLRLPLPPDETLSSLLLVGVSLVAVVSIVFLATILPRHRP